MINREYPCKPSQYRRTWGPNLGRATQFMPEFSYLEAQSLRINHHNIAWYRLFFAQICPNHLRLGGGRIWPINPPAPTSCAYASQYNWLNECWANLFYFRLSLRPRDVDAIPLWSVSTNNFIYNQNKTSGHLPKRNRDELSSYHDASLMS